MKNRVVKIVPPIEPLSLKEIEKYQQFDELIGQYNDYQSTLLKYKIATATATLVLIIGGLGFWLLPKKTGSLDRPPQKSVAGHVEGSMGPFVVPEQAVLIKPNEKTEQHTQPEVKKPQVASQQPKKIVSTQDSLKKDVQGDEPPRAFIAASPVGGLVHLMSYIEKEMHYPEHLRSEGIAGDVRVSFLVLPDSSIADITIAQSLHPDIDFEALRLVNDMPPWQPARQGKVPVSQRFTLPIHFDIETQLVTK